MDDSGWPPPHPTDCGRCLGSGWGTHYTDHCPSCLGTGIAAIPFAEVIHG